MSITFEIVKFKKPTKDDLSNLHMFNPYGSIPILDDDGDSTGWMRNTCGRMRMSRQLH